MKKMRVLTIIPICLMLMLAPVSGIRVGAVTVDIKDNYDAGLLGEEKDGNGKDEDAASTASSSTAANSASKASSAASNTASSTATAAASTVTPTPATTDVAANTASTAATTTTDLPKTGDDNRIMITFIAMLASFSVFLTALLTGKHLKA